MARPQVIALITPYAIANAGWKFYLLFCVMILLNIPVVYFFFPAVRSLVVKFVLAAYSAWVS
jgi:hypothetical protein